ncbi:MAG: GNAT family N-acetyltransferase [Dehalococcoidia bacterium]|nr:GNAT family N-acetyltransferase [Dehalococcoidia bacterium]
MSPSVTLESFDGLVSSWPDLRRRLRWDSVFVLPQWLRVWWQEFGAGVEPYLCAVRQGEAVVGIAPLLVKGEEASFIGSADVCDYLDFVVAPGRAQDFFDILLENLRQKGIGRLDLCCLRPDSTTATDLVGLAESRGYGVSCEQKDVSFELDLPATWDEYLGMLSTKQRHEVRRKLRKLHQAGDVSYRLVDGGDALPDIMDVFLKMLRESRECKAAFMTARMESFFVSLAETMAEAGLLKFGILEFNAAPVAAVMCFDYEGTVYLYNSGYDPQYSSLSVGLLSKVLCIKDSIERGKKRFDFLKGHEAYKYRLGGREVPIYNCQIVLN